MGIVGRISSSLAVAVALTSLAVGCGLIPETGPSRDENGVVTESGELAAFDLQLGDCFNDPGLDQVETVTVVPCSLSHDFEVYHLFQMDDGPYPGADAIRDEWIQGCLAEFESFVGISFDVSALDISAIFPTEESWNELDDREVLCSVTAVSGLPRSGSARDSAA